MPLSLKDFTTLKGLMARTTSDNDPEALASIRAANRILGKAGLTWDKVFARTVTVIAEASGALVVDTKDGLDDRTFEAALDGADGTFRSMLLDIQAKRERGVALSPRQVEVVREAAERRR